MEAIDRARWLAPSAAMAVDGDAAHDLPAAESPSAREPDGSDADDALADVLHAMRDAADERRDHVVGKADRLEHVDD